MLNMVYVMTMIINMNWLSINNVLYVIIMFIHLMSLYSAQHVKNIYVMVVIVS